MRPAAEYTLTNHLVVAPFSVLASRPMCRYPAYPRYGGGAGGGEVAANYRCVAD